MKVEITHDEYYPFWRMAEFEEGMSFQFLEVDEAFYKRYLEWKDAFLDMQCELRKLAAQQTEVDY